MCGNPQRFNRGIVYLHRILKIWASNQCIHGIESTIVEIILSSVCFRGVEKYCFGIWKRYSDQVQEDKQV